MTGFSCFLSTSFWDKSRLHWALRWFCLMMSVCAGMNEVFGQARREVILDAPSDLLWYDDLDEALQAQELGEVVLALDLTRQKRTEVPRELEGLTDLRYLILNRNRLTDFPEWMAKMKDLEVVLADHNRLEGFPEVLLSMPNLRHVSLGENSLREIPLDIDMITQLEILSLWGNALVIFPASLGNLSHLNTLDLLHSQMNYDEQEALRILLPGVHLIMSEPCNCNFEPNFQERPFRN